MLAGSGHCCWIQYFWANSNLRTRVYAFELELILNDPTLFTMHNRMMNPSQCWIFWCVCDIFLLKAKGTQVNAFRRQQLDGQPAFADPLSKVSTGGNLHDIGGGGLLHLFVFLWNFGFTV